MERKGAHYFHQDLLQERRRSILPREEKELTKFFGLDINGLKVPESLSKVGHHLTELEIGNKFKPIFFPNISIAEGVTYPGWKIPVSGLYWSLAKNRVLDTPEYMLGGFWALCETTPKPEFQTTFDPQTQELVEGIQLYSGDFLDDILTQIRDRVPLSPKIPLNSRFGYSQQDVHETVLPEIAKVLNITESALRLPTAVEYNYLVNRGVLGNRFTSTAEWMMDTTLQGTAGVMGGYISPSAIGYQKRTKRAHEDGLPWIGFRLMIIPQQE